MFKIEADVLQEAAELTLTIITIVGCVFMLFLW